MKKIYISVMASLLLFASCSDYLDVILRLRLIRSMYLAVNPK